MFARSFQRGRGDAKYSAMEEEFGERYPYRARHLANHFAMGAPELPLKALVTRIINTIATEASFASVDTILAKLSKPGRLDDYINDITTVPLRLFLETAGMPYDESDLNILH